MRKATYDEVAAIYNEALKWLNSQGHRWNDYKTVACSAVMEFIANSRGLTCYGEDT